MLTNVGRTARLLFASALLALTLPPAAGAAPAVAVYDATEIAYDRYTVIRRLGVEGMRSAFRIRGHADLEGARQALVNEAAQLGADGIINLTCFDKADGLIRRAGYFCHASAIRLKNERRVN